MSQVSTQSVAELTEAFAEFESNSEVLSRSYRALEQQTAQLTHELAESRAQLEAQQSDQARLSARFANLLDALPAGVVVLDHHGLVQESNPAANDLLGPGLVGRPWSQIVGELVRPQQDDGLDIALNNGRLVNIATQALSVEPGQILLINEVTDRRRLQDQLAHHKRLSARTQTASAMAHQIRTPLATALLHTSNLKKAVSGQLSRRAVDRSLAALKKLERLVDDLLLYARGGRFDMAPHPANALAESLVSAARDAATADSFAITSSNAIGSGMVFANRAALCSVAANLTDNSHQNGATSMHINACLDDNEIVLRFADNGPGIQPKAREAVFEPFHSTRINGTGLGLPVARAIARAHDGELLLGNNSDGAEFSLRIPLVKAPYSDTNNDGTEL